ncbi:MAG TPA: PilZ domain-containing protein [Polyangia bacterium]
MTDERRQSPRYTAEIDARVQAEGTVYRARTRDLSRTGMCFTMPGTIPVGTVIVIEAALKLSANAVSEALPLHARVMWCTRLRDGYQVGCAFVNVNVQTAQYLELFLRYLKGEIDVTGAPVLEDADEEGDKFA